MSCTITKCNLPNCQSQNNPLNVSLGLELKLKLSVSHIPLNVSLGLELKLKLLVSQYSHKCFSGTWMTYMAILMINSTVDPSVSPLSGRTPFWGLKMSGGAGGRRWSEGRYWGDDSSGTFESWLFSTVPECKAVTLFNHCEQESTYIRFRTIICSV